MTQPGSSACRDAIEERALRGLAATASTSQPGPQLRQTHWGRGKGGAFRPSVRDLIHPACDQGSQRNRWPLSPPAPPPPLRNP